MSIFEQKYLTKITYFAPNNCCYNTPHTGNPPHFKGTLKLDTKLQQKKENTINFNNKDTARTKYITPHRALFTKQYHKANRKTKIGKILPCTTHIGR